MPTPETRWLCDICHAPHPTESAALECEARGRPEPWPTGMIFGIVDSSTVCAFVGLTKFGRALIVASHSGERPNSPGEESSACVSPHGNALAHSPWHVTKICPPYCNYGRRQFDAVASRLREQGITPSVLGPGGKAVAYEEGEVKDA